MVLGGESQATALCYQGWLIAVRFPPGDDFRYPQVLGSFGVRSHGVPHGKIIRLNRFFHQPSIWEYPPFMETPIRWFILGLATL